EKISEVILAINTDVEGDATAAYISEKLASLGIKTTRIAFGIPADSGIIYTDPITLKRAFNGRLPATKLNLN
ncbi:MAG: toprim domain-containing protein, partial [Kiritimatiellae bacterium]|nr:toprim domain-containing protein [Kiritimatiellia bacterium]